jgi:UDP-GlcNAc:undecaprenyl-phosphate GlcNAc-1-phosphate transferase
MSTIKILLLCAIAFITSFLLTPWARKLSFKIGALDMPNHRKMHANPMATGGGIAIFLGFLAAFLFINRITPEIIGFIIATFIIVILGIFDDILDLSALPKFIFQSLAAFILIYFGVRINMGLILGGRVSDFSYLSIPLTYFWVVGITNAINLIDGLDGLAAGVSTIAAFTIGAVAFLNGQLTVAVLAMIVAFAALGFLPHNFRSRIFMGDTGSMFLGFSLAALSIMGSVKLAAAFAFFVPMMILAIPIFDTVFAILRRIINRRPIYEGDRKHLHHRLLEMGLSPFQVVLFIYALSIIFGGMAILSATLRPRLGYSIFAASVFLVVLGGWGIVLWHQKKTNGNSH